MEWLDALCMGGPVEFEPAVALPRPSRNCRFRGADYTALEDSIDLVLEDDEGMFRVRIDAPLAIWIKHEATGEEQVVFETAAGDVTLSRGGRSSLAS